jgi:hypothetical protein
MVIVYIEKGINYFNTNIKEMYFHATQYSPKSFMELKHTKNNFLIFPSLD